MILELHQRLNRIREEFENGDTPRVIIDVLNAHIEDMLSSDVAEQAISVGEIAPMDLTIQHKESSIPLRHFCGDHYLVLTWFRGNW